MPMPRPSRRPKRRGSNRKKVKKNKRILRRAKKSKQYSKKRVKKARRIVRRARKRKGKSSRRSGHVLSHVLHGDVEVDRRGGAEAVAEVEDGDGDLGLTNSYRAGESWLFFNV